MGFIIILAILAIGFWLLWLSWSEEKQQNTSDPLSSDDEFSENKTTDEDSSSIPISRESIVDKPRVEYNEISEVQSKGSDRAFSEEKMKEINSKGYELYQQAVSQPSAEAFFKAGEAYDRSYSSFWGDNVFGGVDYRSFLANLGVSSIGEAGAKQMIETAQESLVISCECYVKALSTNPDHYWSNLYLATALAASLQVDAALSYWRKSLQLNQPDTSQALKGDSMGFDHRSVAVKELQEP
jgi:tetratricopeptide (TPR) repeat protein